MSFVSISPDFVAATAGEVARVGSTIEAANSAAAASTTHILTAAADEVSTRIAALFGSYGQEYRAISDQVAAYHSQFVATLNAGSGAYATAEALNAEQALLDVINAPTQTLLGRPLIGNGANATTPGGAGGAGGILYGNGGNGAAGTAGQAGGAGAQRDCGATAEPEAPAARAAQPEAPAARPGCCSVWAAPAVWAAPVAVPVERAAAAAGSGAAAEPAEPAGSGRYRRRGRSRRAAVGYRRCGW